MNIAIVDDLQKEKDILKAHLNDYAAYNHLSLSLHCFSSGEEFLENFQPFQYTAVFMDIYMEGMTGIETALRMRELDTEIFLIFLTTSPEHMAEAFSCHAYDYLLKPTQQSRVFKVLDDFMKLQTKTEEKISFQYESKASSLPYSDIVAVCSQGHNTRITDREGRTYIPRISFGSVQKPLQEDSRFLLLLRGVLVNMDYIIDFVGGDCRLKGNLSLPVSSRNRSKIEQIWHNYTFRQIRKESSARRI